MRGLSNSEKELIRTNNYKRFFNQTLDGHMAKLVLFIEKDRLGKKRLYAMSKWQIICPNRQDVAYMQGALNHEIWLLPQKNGYGTFFFSGGCYEVRIYSPKSLGYLFGHTTKLP